MFSKCMDRIRGCGQALAVVMLLTAALTTTAEAAGGWITLWRAWGEPRGRPAGFAGQLLFSFFDCLARPSCPRQIARRYQPEFLGGYKVHFASGPDEVVFPDDIEYGRAHSYDRSEGDWVLVLMRGYAQRTVRHGLADAIQRSELIPAYLKPVALDWLDRSGMMLVAYDRAIRAVVRQDGSLEKASFERALMEQLKALGIPAAQAQALVGFLDEAKFFDRLSLTVGQNGEVFGAYKALGQGGFGAGD